MTATGEAKTIKAEEVEALVGQTVGVSQWRPVTQTMIDGFAEATDDHQWIHTDPERAAAETPFGGTIAHGFLTLSLLSTFAYEALPQLEGMAMGINYGFDEVRFQAPVKSGARVRGVFVLHSADVRPGRRIVAHYDVTVEIEGGGRPALTARWVTVTMLERG